MHKSFIDLEKSGFVMTVDIMRTLPKTLVFNKKQLREVVDFGSVIIGWDKLQTDAQRERVLEMSTSDAPIFTAPEQWRFPQLMRAMGAFKSASQAAKNGWNLDINPGCTEIQFRLWKARGSLWIHKVSEHDIFDVDTDK